MLYKYIYILSAVFIVSIILAVYCFLRVNRQDLFEQMVVVQAEFYKKDREFYRLSYADYNFKLSSSYLYRNVKAATRASENLIKWQLIDSDDFVHYVLPTQVNKSYGEDWRTAVQNYVKKETVVSTFTGLTDFIDSCSILNRQLSKYFRFGIVNLEEKDLSYRDLVKLGKGTCIAMTDMANYTFRALGVPVTTDFTPVWGNLNVGGHTWNVLLTKQKEYPFMGTESGISDYEPFVLMKDIKQMKSTFKLPPKVYRKVHYSATSFNFLGETVEDVTDHYFLTKDLSLHDNVYDVQFMYLATYNRDRYTINSIAQRNGQKFLFKDLVPGLLYFPVSLQTSEPRPMAYPIALFDHCKIQLIPNFSELVDLDSIVLNSLPSEQYRLLSTHGYEIVDQLNCHDENEICPKPIKGKTYHLYIWNFGWKKVRSLRACNNELSIKKVPGNAAYIIKEESIPFEETRPFMYEKGRQVWF